MIPKMGRILIPGIIEAFIPRSSRGLGFVLCAIIRAVIRKQLALQGSIVIIVTRARIAERLNKVIDFLVRLGERRERLCKRAIALFELLSLSVGYLGIVRTAEGDALKKGLARYAALAIALRFVANGTSNAPPTIGAEPVAKFGLKGANAFPECLDGGGDALVEKFIAASATGADPEQIGSPAFAGESQNPLMEALNQLDGGANIVQLSQTD
jgi:hypothetical protein